MRCKTGTFWSVFERIAPIQDGILCSEVFPGLWLDPAAMIRNDMERAIEVLHQGMASKAYSAFKNLLRSRVQS